MAEPESEGPAAPQMPKKRKAKMEEEPEAAPAREIPTLTAVKKARKADLVKWLDELGEKTEGRVTDLRARLHDYIEKHGEAAPPAEAAGQAVAKPVGEAKAKLAEETPGEAGEAEAPVEEAEAAKKAKEPEKAAAEYRAKAKPVLEEATRRALDVRRNIAARRPRFLRQEWYRYARLGEKWRRPQGGQSKLRRHFGYRINVVSIGYRSPRRSRGLHPSGFEEVLVHTPRELEGLDAKRQAIRVAHGVGYRKRVVIQKEAEKHGLRVLNPVEVEE